MGRKRGGINMFKAILGIMIIALVPNTLHLLNYYEANNIYFFLGGILVCLVGRELIESFFDK